MSWRLKQRINGDIRKFGEIYYISWSFKVLFIHDSERSYDSEYRMYPDRMEQLLARFLLMRGADQGEIYFGSERWRVECKDGSEPDGDEQCQEELEGRKGPLRQVRVLLGV